MSVRRAADLVAALGLQPHPEGGWFREVYRSAGRVETARGSRSALTTIYYLLESTQLSRWHVVQSDEIWHYYAGAPLELLAYTPGTRLFERRVLGPVDPAVTYAGAYGGTSGAGPLGAGAAGDLSAGTPEADVAHFDVDLTSTLHFPALGALSAAPSPGDVVSVIPAGVWQAARSLGEYTLVGCSVGPGFEYADFEFVSALPGHREHFTAELAPYASLL